MSSLSAYTQAGAQRSGEAGIESFSEEIIGYMEECLKWQGIRGIPSSLVNILPEPKFDEVQATDEMVMEGIFQRLQEINDEILLNLNAWKYQMNQLKLVNGKTDFSDHIKVAASPLRFDKVASTENRLQPPMIRIQELTITTPKR